MVFPFDISAKEWFRNPNHHNRREIKNFYNDQIDKLNLEIMESQNILKAQRKSLSTREKRDLRRKIKVLRMEIRILKRELKAKLKELEIADKQILAYKNFKYYFKNLKYIIEEINSGLPDSQKIDEQFLDEFKKYTNRETLSPKELASTDFKRLQNKLKKIVIRQFKLAKQKYCYPELPLWRRFFALFGKLYLKDIRESRSGKNDEMAENWIKNLLEELGIVHLGEITIPGSHDAATYSIPIATTTDIVGKIARTQTGNVMAQLKAGIRRFDLRFRSVKGVLLIYHGIVNGGPVLEVVDDIVKFLRAHPKEIIIIEIKATKKDIEKFRNIKRVKETFLPLVYWPGKEGTYNIRNITLNQILKAKKQIWIYRKAGSIENFCTSDITLGKYNPKTRKSGNDKILLDQEEKYAKAQSDSRLISISPIHTPGGKTILTRSVHSKPVKEATKGSFIKNFYELDWRLGGILPNIVSYDNVSNKKIVELVNKKIIRSNFKRNKKKEENHEHPLPMKEKKVQKQTLPMKKRSNKSRPLNKGK